MNWRALWNRRSRSEVFTRLRHGRNHFQGETTTLLDRFPVLFRQCALLLEGIDTPQILSFGCSTGEEVVSLAHYLPDAEIVGVDINAWCIRQASSHKTSPKWRFVHRGSPEFAALSNLDAIFCMAVFQRAEHREGTLDKIESGFTFDLFERELLLLDTKLKPGGLLFLDHCDFAFADTSLSERYEVVHFPHSARARDRPLFGRDNRLIATGYLAERCLRKSLSSPRSLPNPCNPNIANLTSKK